MGDFKRFFEMEGVEVPNFEKVKHEKFKRYKSSRSSSFNTTQSGDGSFNLNVEDGGEKE